MSQLKLNQGIEVYIDKENRTIQFIQLASEQNKTKLAEEFDWLNDEFICTYKIK